MERREDSIEMLKERRGRVENLKEKTETTETCVPLRCERREGLLRFVLLQLCEPISDKGSASKIYKLPPQKPFWKPQIQEDGKRRDVDILAINGDLVLRQGWVAGGAVASVVLGLEVGWVETKKT